MPASLIVKVYEDLLYQEVTQYARLYQLRSFYLHNLQSGFIDFRILFLY